MAETSLFEATTFGEYLRFLRHRMQMTQEELGIALGYSASLIARLETGERAPDMAIVKTTYIDALGLKDEPELAAHLIGLAKAARGDRPKVAAGPIAPGRINNLPAQLTHFIGRQHEIAEVQRLLAASRLVTLTGAGGVGKTRLAIEVGMLFAGTDGVWLVDFAPLTDPLQVPVTVTSVFHLREQTERSPLEVLTTFLREKHILLILDNCEHLMDACAHMVESLLQSCAQCHILVTSREPMRVPGEVVLRVPSLTTPDLDHLPVFEQLGEYEAVQLFVSNAIAVQSDFALTPRNATSVAQICRRLDGIPLALEMAAPLVAGMTVDEIAVGLVDCFTLLTNGSRVALPRHQTLRAMLDWSYNHLTAQEQTLLARLAVFAGGWTVEAAREVCGEEAGSGGEGEKRRGDEVLPVLLRLVQKSMVTATATGDQTRYRLLETVRQYAEGKLRARGEMERVRDQHLAYYLSMAEPMTDLGGRHVDAWVLQIEPEHDNFRAAFAWARAQADKDHGESMLRVAAALRPYRHQRGFFAEGLAWLDEALNRGEHAPALVRANALLAKASILAMQDDSLRSVPCAEAALALFQECNDGMGSAWCLELMVTESMHTMDWQGESLAKQALALFCEAGSQAGIGRCMRDLGVCAFHERKNDLATTHLLEALRVARDIRDNKLLMGTLSFFSRIHPQQAIDLCKVEVELVRQSGDIANTAELLRRLGIMYTRERAYDQAVVFLREGLALLQQHGLRDYSPQGGIAMATQDLGEAEYLYGHYKQAITHLEQAVKLSLEQGDDFRANTARGCLAAACMANGQVSEVGELLHQALEFFPHRGHWAAVEWLFNLMAKLARLCSQPILSARLLGAAEMLVQHFDMASRLYVVGNVDTASAIAETRAQLGDAAFKAAFAEGQAMTPERAIEYGLTWSVGHSYGHYKVR